jgi:Zinc-ribbon/Ring finger domain
MCIDAFLVDNHNCKSGKYMSNCPICQEDLFSSRFASHEMPCGHAIHWHCFKELTSYDTRCPVCKKTAESPEQMAATWSAIAMGIALQPVPPEMARMVNIYCNDCESTDCNLRWHFLGVRCVHCFSFNTNVEQIVMQGRDAAVYLDRMESSSMYNSAASAVPGPMHGGIPTNITMPTAIAASQPGGFYREDSMDEDDNVYNNEESERSAEFMDDQMNGWTEMPLGEAQSHLFDAYRRKQLLHFVGLVLVLVDLEQTNVLSLVHPFKFGEHSLLVRFQLIEEWARIYNVQNVVASYR